MFIASKYGCTDDLISNNKNRKLKSSMALNQICLAPGMSECQVTIRPVPTVSHSNTGTI